MIFTSSFHLDEITAERVAVLFLFVVVVVEARIKSIDVSILLRDYVCSSNNFRG